MAFDAVVVDLDGTIWDSFPWYAKLLSEMSGQDEHALLDQLKRGGNVIRMIDQVGVTRNRFFAKCKRRAGQLEFFPGVCETLTNMQAAGIPLGVVTNLPSPLAQPVCDAKGVTQFLSAFEAHKFRRPSKPNPQGILDVLKTMRINPSLSALYVGDLAVDAAAARNAGISFVWARYGYGHLTDEPRVAAIDAFAELAGL